MRLTFYGQRSTSPRTSTCTTRPRQGTGTMFSTMAALAAGTILVGFLAIGFGIQDELAELAALRRPPSSRTSVRRGPRRRRSGGASASAGADLVWWAYARPGAAGGGQAAPRGGRRRRREPLLLGRHCTAGSPTCRRRSWRQASTAGSSGGSSGARSSLVAYVVRAVQPCGDRGPERRGAPVRHRVRRRRGRARRLLPGDGRRCDHRADLPAARRRARRRAPAAAARPDRGAGAARRPGRVRAGRGRADRVRRTRRPAVRREPRLDLGLRPEHVHPLPRLDERPLALHGAPDRDRHRRGDRRCDPHGPRAPAGLLRADPRPRVRAGPALHRPGPGALLRGLGDHDDPALRPHGRLGREPAAGGDDAVRRLHPRRVAADAGGDRLPGRHGRHVRAVGADRATRTSPPGSSSPSRPRSASRRRSSRCTAGSRRPTASRRPRWRRCSRASISKAGAYGLLRLRRAALSQDGPRLALVAARARAGRPPVRLARRVPPARRSRRRRLLEPRPDEPDHHRDLRVQHERVDRRDLPDGEPRRRLAGGVPPDRPRRDPHGHRPLRLPRRARQQPAGRLDRAF